MRYLAPISISVEIDFQKSVFIKAKIKNVCLFVNKEGQNKYLYLDKIVSNQIVKGIVWILMY